LVYRAAVGLTAAFFWSKIIVFYIAICLLMLNYFSQILKGILFLLLISNHAFAQQNAADTKAIAKFDSVRNKFPREKLYIQLDKSVYAPQDTLWFKAYLVNASLLEASKVSGLIYFELFDSNGKNVQRICLPTAMGITWGGFALKQELYKAGTYTFRAYTNWMLNFDDEYIFKKEVKIVDFLTEDDTFQPDKKLLKAPKKTNTISPEKANDFDIQFLPEGGNWIANSRQRIAFKAVNGLGDGVKISGEIFNSNQSKILDFESNDKGMGYFYLPGNESETYRAKISSKQSSKTGTLPKVSKSGSYLQVNNNYASDSLSVNMFSDLPEQEITMLGQSRGILCFVARFKSGKKYNTLKISKNLFPTGVCQILLTDSKNRSLNQRNFFINHQDELRVGTKADRNVYSNRDSICIDLSVTDWLKRPVSGSFSIAVTDDNQVKKDSLNDDNILSHLLLTSDLKGEVESPGYYFNNFNEQKHNDLDALMLTQGWVSYNWESSKKPAIKAEKDFEISGRVTNIANKPGVNAQILLLSTKKPISIFETTTNANGEFAFKDFPPLDSASFVVQVKNSKGKWGTLGFEMNDTQTPPFVVPPPKKQIINTELVDSTSNQFIAAKSDEYQAAFKNGIMLREVKITGKRVIKGSKNLNGDGNADITLNEDDLDKVAKKTLLQVLEETIKGFHHAVAPKSGMHLYKVNGSVFRLIIDGVEVDFFYNPVQQYSRTEYYDYIKEYLDYYNAEDIKGIEVMTSSKNVNRYVMQYENPFSIETYVYVEVTTRSGQGPFLRKSSNMYRYKPPTYGDNKVFYSPKYTSVNREDKKPDYRSTIYWNPHILTNQLGKASFSFFSADKKGSYTVWIEGTDTQGNFGFKTMKIEIK